MTTAGSKVLAADTPSVATAGGATAAGDTTFSSTSFASATVDGTVIGTTFIAPTSGSVLVLWSARMSADTGGGGHRVLCSVKVSTGSTIDSGSVVSPASDDSALETPETASGGTVGQSRLAAGMWRVVTGLTAGSTYNVVIQQKVATALTGNMYQRDVAVLPIL
jgi:hypothetical protein